MTHTKLAAIIGFAVTVAWFITSSSLSAQTPACTSAPAPPANADASVSSPGAPDYPALVRVQWVASASSSPNEATSYFVEVGTTPGATDVATFNTGNTAISTVQPSATGTYFVRVRSVNACGRSAPSPEPAVTVTGSTTPGEPAARRVVGFFGDDGEGFVYVVGEARGAWGARPTASVRMDSTFYAADGQEIGTAFSYVLGRTRRQVVSRLVEDSTLAAGETGCYLIYTDIPWSKVTRATSVTSWEPLTLEPLRGSVVQQSVQKTEGSVGEARIEGTVRNDGAVQTYFNEVILNLHDANNEILHCDFTFVVGSRLQTPSGIVTDSALNPGQVGTFLNFHPVHATDVSRVHVTTGWDEADTAAAGAGASLSFRNRTWSLLERTPLTDRTGRAWLRNLALSRFGSTGTRLPNRPTSTVIADPESAVRSPKSSRR